ncbi:MAG: Rieske 2Fe-2S domain-containing protein [Ginsengibacter sp.]
MKNGWYQIEFEKNINSDIHLCRGKEQQLIIVKKQENFFLYNAICPHRCANLGVGGQLHENYIQCPFHGCKIGLDTLSDEGYILSQLPLFREGEMLFTTKNQEENDRGFRQYFKNLSESHFIIPGFEMEVQVKPEMVIENAFDQMHFRTVHSILNEPKFDVMESQWGEYRVTGVFKVPQSAWQKDGTSQASSIDVPYEAIAFSPYVVISQLKGSNPYFVITSAREITETMSKIYLSIAIPNERFSIEELPLYKYLISQSEKGLLLDKQIWENLDPNGISRFQKAEKSVIGFQKFKNQF